MRIKQRILCFFGRHRWMRLTYRYCAALAVQKCACCGKPREVFHG